jgi:hypothetical protein
VAHGVNKAVHVLLVLQVLHYQQGEQYKEVKPF